MQDSIISQTENALDQFHIERALKLAWLAAGQTDPNPLVGALVVSNGVVVGEGYHERSGRPHAEVIALDAAGPRSQGGTLYVTLEPCSHQGKTPPCVDRIIASGVRRVVACTVDPDARVSGRGIQKLIENNIEIHVGIQQEQAVLLNLAYFKKRLSLGSAVTLKVAMTIDGKIASAPGMRNAISGSNAQKYVHRLRAENDAVVIGIDTLLTDRPRLDCRCLPGLPSPVPVVLDSSLRFPIDYPWVGENRKFCICCAEDADDAAARRIEKTGGQVIRCRSANGVLDINHALTRLAGHGISKVLIEGGGRVLTSFIESNSWDAMHVFIASAFFGEDGVSLYRNRSGLENADAISVDARRIGDDFLLRYINRATMDKLRKGIET